MSASTAHAPPLAGNRDVPARPTSTLPADLTADLAADVGVEFASALAGLRRDAGWTQEQLAEAAGMSSRTVGNLERGRVLPHRRTLRRLVDALGPEADQRLAPLAGRRGEGRHARRNRHPAGAVEGLLPGRDGELALVADLAAATFAPGAGTAPATVVLSGPAGVGKSALAHRAAACAAARHGVPHLTVHLRGSERLETPPGVALAHLLDGAGVDEARRPHPVKERSDLWRAVAAQQRGVLVLDDAAGEEQVRPLLPITPGWLVLVTGRRALAGLFGARWCRLEPDPDGVGAGPGDDDTGPPPRLAPAARRLLDRLAELPPGDHPIAVAQALLGSGRAEAETAVDALVEAGLIADAPRPGHFRRRP